MTEELEDESKRETVHLNAFNHSKTCPACLGILQRLDDNVFLQNTIDTIKNSGYETNLYYLALTVPVSINVRHFQLWYHLQDTFPTINFLQTAPTSSDVADVKEVFKWIVGHLLYVKIGIKFQFEARFQARLNMQHAETQLECLSLAPEIDAAQFLKDLEAEKRHFLGLASEPSSSLAEMERAADDGNVKNEEHQYSNQGPPRKRKKGASIDGVTTVNTKLRSLSKAQFISLMSPEAPRDPVTNAQHSPQLKPVEQMAEFEFSFHHLSVFVGGRYCKYSRKVSQSPWFIDGLRKAEKSVQEFVGEVLVKHFKAVDYKFMSAGREDIDVRMLGRGRPFVMEVVNPKRPHLSAEEYRTMQREMNAAGVGLVHYVDLQEVTEKQVALLKEGEDSKKKSYRAVVWAADALSPATIESLANHNEFTIDQLTPVRVLHRRSLMNRKKTIHKMAGQFINDHYAILDLTTQAGTYIKEFVHSDLGRTKPSFCEFIKQDQADILLLDVMAVDLDFPPKLQNEEEPPEAPSILEGLDITRLVPEKPTGSELSLME